MMLMVEVLGKIKLLPVVMAGAGGSGGRGDGDNDNSSGGVDGPEMLEMLVEVETAGVVMMTEVTVAMVVAAG